MATLLARCLVNQESTRTDYATLLQRFDEERAKGFGNEDLNGWPPLVEGWFHKAIEALEKQACIFEGMSDAGELDYPCTREGCENCCLPKQCRWLQVFIYLFDVLCSPKFSFNTIRVEELNSTFLEMLLQHEEFDPTAYNSSLLRNLAQWECSWSNLVEVLLKDGRADPAAYESEALSLAARKGNVKVVDLLLTDGRADPLTMKVPEGVANRLVLILLHEDVCARFLMDPRITSDVLKALLTEACRFGQLEQVKLILRNERLALTADEWGQTVCLTLNVFRLDLPSYNSITGHVSRLLRILECLYNDPRVHPLRKTEYEELLEVMTLQKGSAIYQFASRFRETLLNDKRIAYKTRLYYKMFG